MSPSAVITIESGLVVGVEGRRLEVEVWVEPNTAAKPRSHDIIIRAALRSADLPTPSTFRVRLTPDLPRDATSTNFAAALGLLAATDTLPHAAVARLVALGELGADGLVSPVRGTLPILYALRAQGPRTVVLPRAMLPEAQLVDGLTLLPADSLGEAITILRHSQRPSPTRPLTATISPAASATISALRNLAMPPFVTRALDLAAAGEHHLLLVGPRGSATTWLGRQFPDLLPPPTLHEALTITTHHSAAGIYNGTGLITNRPCRAPHHTVSMLALLGGTARSLPGELTLAHHGVLLLDDVAEFRAGALEAIATALRERRVQTRWHDELVTLPTAPLVIATQTPCPCGRLGHPNGHCRCTPAQISSYQGRVPPAFRRTMDLIVSIPFVTRDDQSHPEPFSSRRERVNAARDRRALRAATFDPFSLLTAAAARQLRLSTTGDGLSSPGAERLVRVALTLADLSGTERITDTDLREAMTLVQYTRDLDGPSSVRA